MWLGFSRGGLKLLMISGLWYKAEIVPLFSFLMRAFEGDFYGRRV